MHSTYNKRKSVVAERFIRTLKKKQFKKMLQALRNCVVVNIKKSTRLCLNSLSYNLPEYAYRWVNDRRKTFICRKIRNS